MKLEKLRVMLLDESEKLGIYIPITCYVLSCIFGKVLDKTLLNTQRNTFITSDI